MTHTLEGIRWQEFNEQLERFDSRTAKGSWMDWFTGLGGQTKQAVGGFGYGVKSHLVELNLLPVNGELVIINSRAVCGSSALTKFAKFNLAEVGEMEVTCTKCSKKL
jgi:hypothetical protein